MKSCKCGSFAINEKAHGREPGKHTDLCDVCYWREEHRLLELMLGTRSPSEPELDERTNCENCNQVYEREYGNGGKQCFGLVKSTFRDCDVIRACQKYDNGKMFLQDLSPDEAAEMATGYAAVVRTWFSFFYKRPCETCDQKEPGCNVAE